MKFYHGTDSQSMQAICKEGLKPIDGTAHLTTDIGYAKNWSKIWVNVNGGTPAIIVFEGEPFGLTQWEYDPDVPEVWLTIYFSERVIPVEAIVEVIRGY